MEIYRRFILNILIGTIVILILIVGSNIIIDPYEIYQINHKDNIAYRSCNEKTTKVLAIIEKKPEILFLGSSRVRIGIDPEYYKTLKKQDKKEVYNAACSGGDVYEIKRFLEHAIGNQKEIREVYIGLDFFAFDKFYNKPIDAVLDAQMGKNHITPGLIINTVLSQGSTLDSLKCKLYNKKSKEYLMNSNGKNNEEQFTNDYSSLNFFEERIKSSYELSNDKLELLKDIVALCKKNNIQLFLFINPVHSLTMEEIWLTNNWNNYEQWKRELVNIYPIYDFSGYNEITKEQKYFWNTGHYRKQVGDWILDRLTGNIKDLRADEFGVLVTNENIEDHLVNTREMRKSWIHNEPEKYNELISYREKSLKK